MRKSGSFFVSLALLASLLFLYSCATAPPPAAVEEPKAEVPALSPEEQQAKAKEKFMEMLDLTANVARHTVIADLEKGYIEIINKYPDSYLAEESYWRLIIMNLEDFYPPRTERAEELYREYFRKYPKPQLDNAVNDTMARFYFRMNMWEKLATFCLPFMREYVKTGNLPSPLFMFFYSEAKFQLKEFEEAARGFKILIQRFPDSREALHGRERLEDMSR